MQAPSGFLSSQAMQASPHISGIEDRHIVQLTIDGETNGSQFEFPEEFLAKEIRIRGFMFLNTLATWVDASEARGEVELQIEWLKVIALTQKFGAETGQTVSSNFKFPWDFDPNNRYKSTHNLSMDIPITLPTKTSMRKRFKMTLCTRTPSGGLEPLPINNEIFRFTIILEIVHDHVFL